MLKRACRLSADAIKLNLRRKDLKYPYCSRRLYSQSQNGQRLRILFCGSDEFSITSLKALYNYSQESGSTVASIDVAAKTDKRVGRGLKVIRPPPIKPVAESLGLPIHQFDTFRGWNLPVSQDGQTYINMIVAVSFGLLVPPRILGSCQYGGLNVHPSMLPDLRGSAPIEHAIINGYRKTGVTVQTLHPSKFDEGEIVMQTPMPGLDIPNPDSITASELRSLLAPIGADMLVECLKGHHYLHLERQQKAMDTEGTLNHAPKLSPSSRHIIFQSMNSTHILRLNRALGRLWAGVSGKVPADTRLIFGQNMEETKPNQLKAIDEQVLSGISPGLPFNVIGENERAEDSNLPLVVKTCDSRFITFSETTFSGTKPGTALASAARAGLVEESAIAGGRKLCIFRGPLC